MKPERASQVRTTPARSCLLIVDDHPLMRMGLAEALGREPDLEVCAAVESAEESLTPIEKLRPDLVVLDLNLPGKCGLELIKDLASLRPSLPVIVLSMHDEEMYAERCLRAGALGYVSKGDDAGKLAAAVRCVIAGEIHLSEKMSARVLRNFSGRQDDGRNSPTGRLTDRELEVFRWIGRGTATAKIANRLHVSRKTIESHRTHIKTKLGLSTSTELIAYAARWAAAQD